MSAKDWEPSDGRCWLQLVWLINHMEARQALRENERLSAMHCAAMSLPNVNNSAQKNWDTLRKLLEQARAIWQPWNTAKSRGPIIASMTADWERAFGKLDDPVTQKKISETIRYIQEQAAAARRQPLERLAPRRRPPSRLQTIKGFR